MLYNFLELNRSSSISLTHQLYEALRNAIESGRLTPGEHLLSIRQASSELGLSRTTVENAYQRLTLEGYAESHPQSGYRVRSQLPKRKSTIVAPKKEARYDFTTHGTDPEEADLDVWRKLLKGILTDVKAVSTYGEAQGELKLRKALSSYSFRARGVVSDPSTVFIGAGTGALLQLLCPLLDRSIPVFAESPGFTLLERVFTDYGYSVSNMDSLSYPENDKCLMIALPSMRPRRSAEEISMEREKLSSWLSSSDSRYILEDDYNGELRYRTRPLSSFQALVPDRTIYIGSFSKLLLPSVRIAYMVLPEPLAEKARERLSDQNQTAGKTEQLALAEYIDSGLLEKHLRRLRRIYLKKSQVMESMISKVFGRNCEYEFLETSLSFVVYLDEENNADEIIRKADERGIAIRKAPKADNAILLCFSSVSEEDIVKGLGELSLCI